MLDSILLADWTTLVGSTSASEIIQPANQWLDLPEHEDVIFFLDVKEVGGTVTMSYETSPSRQSSQFVPMIAPISLSVTSQPRVDRALFAANSFPLARFLRWRVQGSGVGSPWDVTFRIWIVAYSYG